MQFDVYLDSGVTVDADADPDNSPSGEPWEGDDHKADYDAFKAKAGEKMIEMIRSGQFDISYDRTTER